MQNAAILLREQFFVGGCQTVNLLEVIVVCGRLGWRRLITWRQLDEVVEIYLIDCRLNIKMYVVDHDAALTP